MAKKQKYYSLVVDGTEANINIYGDICEFAFEELGEVNAIGLAKQLETLNDVSTINVHISSYGGDVKEGLAIYNTLKNHKAKIKTYCDSFACSIASVIFMAGEERIMSNASLLMIHNAWTCAQGNANELRKQADDLEIITGASINAYMEHLNITEKQLKKLMDNETWLTPQKALEMGFATSIDETTEEEKVSQNVKNKLIKMILQATQEDDDEEETTTSNDDSLETDDTSKEDDTEETEDDVENAEEKAKEKMIAFFNAISKM